MIKLEKELVKVNQELQKAQEAAYQYILDGDLSRLNPTQQAQFCAGICERLGLNALTRPFEFIRLNNKQTLYAKKDATDQLRKVYNVSVVIASRGTDNGVHSVTARATLPNGRTDESVGAVTVQNLKGDALCNALMKAETKAKRRVTLSICGLGLLDESELETIPQQAFKDQKKDSKPEIDRPEVVPPLRPIVWDIQKEFMRVCQNSIARKSYLKDVYKFESGRDLNDKKDDELTKIYQDLKSLTSEKLDHYMSESS